MDINVYVFKKECNYKYQKASLAFASQQMVKNSSPSLFAFLADIITLSVNSPFPSILALFPMI